MPKKRNLTKLAKPSSPAHPSLESRAKNDGVHSLIPSSSSGSSVSEKLHQLRLEQKSAVGASTVPSIQLSAAHTAHVSMREILQIPEPPPQMPRPGLRIVNGRRTTPGPPPPGSWIQRSIATKNSLERLECERARTEIEALPGTHVPKVGTLLDRVYRTLAQNWDRHVHFDQYCLATLPVRHKEVLLRYIALYSRRGIGTAGLEILFLDEAELEDATGADGLTHLDLSGSVGTHLALKDLKRFFTRGMTRTEGNLNELPESWESTSPVASLSCVPKFNTLTHLSLSHPSTSATWKDLLDFSPHLSSITHLSLGYWPTPTLTPNSSTAYTSTPSGNVSYGASDFYSQYDNDWNEAASIIRRLSKHTLCLTWLDLTGCYPWIKCLSCTDIPWCGAWAGVSTLKLSQGSLPGYLRKIHEMERTSESTNPNNTNPPITWTASDLTVDEMNDLFSWTTHEKRHRRIERDIRAQIQRTATHRLLSPSIDPAESAEANASSDDDWSSRRTPRNRYIPNAGARTTRLEVDYGWRDPWIRDAMKHAENYTI